MADVFRRIYVSGATQAGQNLPSGHGLGEGDDYLVHELESLQHGDSLPGQLQAPGAGPGTGSGAGGSGEDPFTSDDIYFLTEHHERLNIQLALTDVTPLVDPVKSTELWFLHMGGFGESAGSSVLSRATPMRMSVA